MGADKELIRKRFEANFRRYHRLALVQKEICAELGELAAGLCGTASVSRETSSPVSPPIDGHAIPGTASPVSRAMEIGVGTGFLTSHLARLFPHAEWFLNDISDASETFVAGSVPCCTAFMWGDAENMEFPQGLDLIASASTVQWFDDLPGFARRASAATRPGGWLVLSTFGPDNFREIRNVTGEGLEYYSLAELTGILESAGYEVVSGREYSRVLRFDTPLDVLHHIKATGVNSLRQTRWGRRQLDDFDTRYKAAHSEGESVVLTYHPILIAARKT